MPSPPLAPQPTNLPSPSIPVYGIADGTMKLGPCSVGFISQSGQPGTEMSCSFNEWTASFVAAYDLWSCHSLVGYGSSIRDLVREAGHDPLELDGMIRGGPNPYDGLPDLARRFCGRRQELETQGHSTVVELVAPLAVRFGPEAATTSADGIAVGLKAAAEVYVEKAEIAWTVGAAGLPPRHGSRELRTCDWSREGDTPTRRWTSRFSRAIPPPPRSSSSATGVLTA